MTEEAKKLEPSRDNLKPYMLWLLLLTFAAPIGAAFWLYSIGGTENTVNKGEFVKPGVQLLEMGLKNIDGSAVSEKQLYGRWHMMYFMATDCSGSCEEMVYTMRQIKTSFHKDSERISNILIHFDEKISDSFQQRIKTHYSNFERYYADKEVFNKKLDYSADELMEKGIVFIVDPIGNVILKYNKDKTAKDIISDFKRLLKASQIG